MTETADDTTGQKLLPYRVGVLEKAFEEAVGEMRDAVLWIAQSVAKLTVVEERLAQSRESLKAAHGYISALDKRLREAELELPTLRLIRTWVISGVVGVLGLVGAAVVALVLR